MKALTLSYPVEAAGRSAVVDELRGLAILLILTYHIGGVTGFPNKVHGDLGVDVFVLLSGAALALNHRPEEGFWRFLWRRFARLLPAYWIALTAFWLGGKHLLNRIHTPTDVWSHYFCIHPWWGDQYFLSINDSFWFLGLIALLYPAYALLRRFLEERIDVVIGVGLIFSFVVCCWTYFKMGQPSVFVHLGLRPSIFFVGVGFGALLRRGSLPVPLTPWLGLGVLLALYGMFLAGTLVGYTVAGFSIFFAYFAMRANADGAGRRWLCRGLAWAGVYSYEIFLLHQPLMREYNHFAWNRFAARVPNELELALGVAASLVVTALLAFLLHHLGAGLARLLSPRASKPAGQLA